MKKTLIFACMLALCGTAHAITFTHVNGTIRLTNFSDNEGATLRNIPPQDRMIIINDTINSSASTKQLCKDYRFINERVCIISFDQSVQFPNGVSSCLYTEKYTLDNFTSKSKIIPTTLLVKLTCASGYKATANYSGKVTRS